MIKATLFVTTRPLVSVVIDNNQPKSNKEVALVDDVIDNVEDNPGDIEATKREMNTVTKTKKLSGVRNMDKTISKKKINKSTKNFKKKAKIQDSSIASKTKGKNNCEESQNRTEEDIKKVRTKGQAELMMIKEQINEKGDASQVSEEFDLMASYDGGAKAAEIGNTYSIVTEDYATFSSPVCGGKKDTDGKKYGLLLTNSNLHVKSITSAGKEAAEIIPATGQVNFKPIKPNFHRKSTKPKKTNQQKEENIKSPSGKSHSTKTHQKGNNQQENKVNDPEKVKITFAKKQRSTSDKETRPANVKLSNISPTQGPAANVTLTNSTRKLLVKTARKQIVSQKPKVQKARSRSTKRPSKTLVYEARKQSVLKSLYNMHAEILEFQCRRHSYLLEDACVVKAVPQAEPDLQKQVANEGESFEE